jgi:hypothetical protein
VIAKSSEPAVNSLLNLEIARTEVIVETDLAQPNTERLLPLKLRADRKRHSNAVHCPKVCEIDFSRRCIRRLSATLIGSVGVVLNAQNLERQSVNYYILDYRCRAFILY